MIRKKHVLRFLRYFVIVCGAILMVIPLLWMLSSSLKEPTKVFVRPVQWIPDKPVFDNFIRLFTYYHAERYIWNTIKLCAINIVGTLLSCSLVAYGLSFIRYKHKNKILTVLMSTMMLPGCVIFFPQFILYVKLGWYGTLLPLWVPSFLGNAYYIILLRQYFMTIPQPVLDAARVSGCGHLRMLFKVVLPMAKPVLIMMFLGTFVGTWTDLFNPLIYILNEEDKTFSLMLTYLNSSYGNKSTLPVIMAAGFITMIPTLIVYFVAQKHMVKAYVFKNAEE